MNKILLISELDKTANDLNEYLSGNYQVQLCVKQAEDVQAMVKIVKPQLVIICQANGGRQRITYLVSGKTL